MCVDMCSYVFVKSSRVVNIAIEMYSEISRVYGCLQDSSNSRVSICLVYNVRFIIHRWIDHNRSPLLNELQNMRYHS